MPADHVTSRKLDLIYPFDFSPTGEFEIYPRDEGGVPQVYYPHLQRLVYNPITVAQYGLHQLSVFAHTHDSHARAEALLMADWLVAHLRAWRSDLHAWVFDFDLPFYGPAAPWISALAQGQGISLLLRACAVNHHPSYEEACRRAVAAFYHRIEAGGVARNFPEGALAFEEYPTREPSLVLNGILFALLGLLDYATYFSDTRARSCFEAGMLGVKKNLLRYDTGYWNFYDLHRSRRLASPMYVDIHARLLRAFAALLADDELARVAKKWRGYLRSPFCRTRFYGGKMIEKVRLRFIDYSVSR
ncbi:MAG: D-glucuronyl C5-epimerase family protein [candidate division KSB1 bacterium]